MINREFRSRIAQETLSILDAGGYENAQGKSVDIAGALQQAKAGSVHYRTGALRQLAADHGSARQAFATKIEVRNEPTLAAARRLRRKRKTWPSPPGFIHASCRSPQCTKQTARTSRASIWTI